MSCHTFVCFTGHSLLFPCYFLSHICLPLPAFRWQDFLGRACVTPDCNGKITSIRIYDDAGELKNELVKDKKDRKHMAAPVKQKKKK